MEEERSLSIPSSESEDNVRLRGRIQRRFKRSNHSERLLTEPTHNGTKGRWALGNEFTLHDLALIFHSPAVFGDRRQKSQIRGKSTLVTIATYEFSKMQFERCTNVSQMP